MRPLLVIATAAALIAVPAGAAGCTYCGDPDLMYSPSGSGPRLTEADMEQGFYVVTKAFTGNTVSQDGNTTTFGFTTAEVRPTTVAKDLSTVRTGQTSPLDGRSMNVRPTMSDGRPVAGTYVESFTLDTSGNKISIGITFLPDDTQTVDDPPPVPPATSEPAPRPAPRTPDAPPPATPDRPQPIGVDRTPPEDTRPAPPHPPADGLDPDAPGDRWVPREPVATTPPPPATPRPPAPPTPAPPAPRDVRAGVALAPQADVLARIEVLRGRRVSLWLRGAVDGAPARVVSWRLVGGEATALGPIGGGGDDPFVAQWLLVGKPGDVFALAFDVLVEVRGGSPRPATARIEVVVRSPAIVE